MKTILPLFAVLLASCFFANPLAAQEKQIPNPLIDYPGFLKDAEKVGELRKQRRITEEDFIKMAAEPGTVVLDARSAEKYGMLHIEGAKNLSLPDVTATELTRIIPEKTTRVLIYCNNNFIKEPVALPTKTERASLNIYTFNTLYSYGYSNVYELGPMIDVEKTSLKFEGTRVKKE